MKKPFVLAILDGWGLGEPREGNAIFKARTPNFEHIENTYPSLALQASGIAVGLMWGEAGNSEVGHLNIGSGRVIYQTLPRILLSIRDESFFANPVFSAAAEHSKKNNSALHLFGMVSSGSVHSYIDHLYALLEFCNRQKLEKVFLHVITDGRDSSPQEAGKFIGQLQIRLEATSKAKIASVGGRHFAMDRDGNWDRIKKAYDCLVEGKGVLIKDPAQYLKDAYVSGLDDQHIEPAAVIGEDGVPTGLVQNGDSLIFFNFREDRARQISRAFVRQDFKEFGRKFLPDLYFAAMTEYEKGLPNVAFGPQKIEKTLAEVLAENNLTQLHIAETEKYAHITYFLNGGKEEQLTGEDWTLVPSIKTPRHEEYPGMRAAEIAEKTIEAMAGDKYDFIAVNFAGADMVGHSGDYRATIKAIEAVDKAVGRIHKEVLERDGILMITADHGNAEEKLDPMTGEIKTEHTSNPVPVYLAAARFAAPAGAARIPLIQRKEIGGALADIAPTVLELLNLPKPPQMTGQSLLPLLTGK